MRIQGFDINSEFVSVLTGGGGGWRSGEREGKNSSGRVPEEQVKQLVAMATVLTHLSPAVSHSIHQSIGTHSVLQIMSQILEFTYNVNE